MTGMLKHTKWMAMGMMMAVVGCQSSTTPRAVESTDARGDVTDIRPMQSTTPAYQPAASTPAPVVVTPAPVDASVSATPASSAVAANTHVVKRGETLYSIARQSYGDGKQWQKIASANPGVAPSSLKVGQTLVIP